ncbi:MAG: proline racemase family protein [Armatimonadota bacterium]|nr:proline racemase family protein [Armatimonadota bacterium]MDR7533524.1 proline racemase family protein [Armatimonadota bacterium]
MTPDGPPASLATRLAALLREAAAAHHRAFAATGGEDPDWPLWYADYLQGPVSALLGRPVTRSALTCALAAAERAHRRQAPQADWPPFYADVLLAELAAPGGGPGPDDAPGAAIPEAILAALRRWRPPGDRPVLTVVDAHAAGEPLRVVTGGCPPVPGSTMAAKRRYAAAHLDHLRRALVFEPRGHADMYGAVLTDPVTPDGDLGVLFLHTEGWSTMCGHGVIALATVLVETGAIPAAAGEVSLRLDTPAGRVLARARVKDGRVRSVTFENVPSFVTALDQTVEVPGLGTVRYDIAFGGAFYAYCEAAPLGLHLVPGEYRRLIEIGAAITRAVAAAGPVRHPDDADLGFLYGTILTGAPHAPGAHSRHVCVFAQTQVDRSPTGTGVSGRLALEHARSRLAPGEALVVESLIGTRFVGRIVGSTTVGSYPAVVPEIEGSAALTGRAEFVLDPADPLREGFFLR